MWILLENISNKSTRRAIHTGHYRKIKTRRCVRRATRATAGRPAPPICPWIPASAGMTEQHRPGHAPPDPPYTPPRPGGPWIPASAGMTA